jgi:hypothetical protein
LTLHKSKAGARKYVGTEENFLDTLSQLRDEFSVDKAIHIGLGITARSQYEAVQSKFSVTV